MNREELIRLLSGHEWNDVEFKRAQRGVPDSAYETVSSFSNTSGGWLIFGIHDNGGQYEIAGVIKVDKLYPTRASILIFGSPPAIHQMLPRPTLDVQWIPSGFDDPLPDIRWLDRVVLEDNLIVTWRGLVSRYMQKAEKPFRIDPHTLLRNDAPPEYRVFREAAINLLIHQDYASHGFKAVIKFYDDVIQFWNPGDVFGNADELLEPGEKEVRNPQIVAAFRRLGLCEQAGTGLRMVFDQWRALGHPVPEYENDRSRKAFEIRLPLRQNQVGTRSVPSRYQDTGAVTDQATDQVTDQVKRLLDVLGNEEIDAVSMMARLSLSHRPTFRSNYLHPALKAGFAEMTIPDKPRSSKQKYRLTEKGRQVLAGIQGDDE